MKYQEDMNRLGEEIEINATVYTPVHKKNNNKKKTNHYEITHIQIYWKLHHQKLKIFR